MFTIVLKIIRGQDVFTAWPDADGFHLNLAPSNLGGWPGTHFRLNKETYKGFLNAAEAILSGKKMHVESPIPKWDLTVSIYKAEGRVILFTAFKTFSFRPAEFRGLINAIKVYFGEVHPV